MIPDRLCTQFIYMGLQLFYKKEKEKVNQWFNVVCLDLTVVQGGIFKNFVQIIF